MYRQIALLCGAALLGLANAQQPQLTTPPEPGTTGVPRKPFKKRQNDPRTIEIHQAYAAPIGVDTNYLTMEGSTTKWIGVNTEYLTELTQTSTIDDVESTTVAQAQLAVVTATEASEGVDVGDVTVLIPETLQDELDAIIKEAATSCAGAAKLRKRDSMSCMIDAIQGAAQNEETLGLLNPSDWDGFALELADNAPEILGAAVQVLKTQAERNKFALMVAAAGTVGAWNGAELVHEVAHKFIFDSGLFGHPAEDSGDGNDQDEDDGEDEGEQEPTTTSTATKCDPSAEVNENSPACDDEDCKGEEEICQAEGDNKDCKCVLWTEYMVEGLFDREWSDTQQEILAELEADLPDVIPPQCFRNTHGNRFDGEPAAEPSAFCHCSSVGGEGPVTKGNYPTMSGEGDDACTYTTMPSETISISMKPKETVVTSCRMESSYGPEPYCTCNDDAMHGHIVTTISGSETTVCPDATATPTNDGEGDEDEDEDSDEENAEEDNPDDENADDENADDENADDGEVEDGTPTEKPTCYPKHGPPNDQDKDRLIMTCWAREAEFRGVCKSEPQDQGISVPCPMDTGGTQRPISNNHYQAWFEKADNAPADCDYLFGENGSDDEDAVNKRVDNLCVPVFMAIRNTCDWTGGEVKNQCGTFKYQSCPKGEECKPGDPLNHG